MRGGGVMCMPRTAVVRARAHRQCRSMRVQFWLDNAFGLRHSPPRRRGPAPQSPHYPRRLDQAFFSRGSPYSGVPEQIGVITSCFQAGVGVLVRHYLCPHSGPAQVTESTRDPFMLNLSTHAGIFVPPLTLNLERRLTAQRLGGPLILLQAGGFRRAADANGLPYSQ